MASVNRRRFRRSGMRKILAKASNSFTGVSRSTLYSLRRSDDLCLAAGFLDLFRRGFGEHVRLDVDFTRNLARAQHFQPVAELLDHAELDQPVYGERVTGEFFEVSQVYDREFFLENIGEAALRQ